MSKFRSFLSRAGSLALLVAAGCGGVDATPSVEIRMGSAALLDGTAELALYFYGPDQSCDAVRATLPRPRALLGPFVDGPRISGKTAGTFVSRSDIPVGEYVVLVDALSATGAVLGTGCAQQQRVVEGHVSRIQVVVDPLPE